MMLLLACAPAEGDFQSADLRLDAGETGATVSGLTTCQANGELTVAWSDPGQGRPAVWMTSFAERWLPAPVRVDDGVAMTADPTVACVPGAQIVAWEDTRDGTLGVPNIYARGSMAGGTTWLADPARLGDDTWGWFESQGAKALAVGRNVYVVWQDARYGTYDVFFASSADWGSTWSAAVRLDWDDEGAAWSGNPSIAADAAGHVIVAWEDLRNGESDIYVTASADFGVTWSDDARVDTGDDKGVSGAYRPRVVTDGIYVWVLWEDDRNSEEGDTRDLLLNWSQDFGTTWMDASTMVEYDLPGASDSIALDVVAVGGLAHVTWQDRRLEGYDVYYRQLVGGMPVGADVMLEAYEGSAANSIAPRVATDGQNVVVAWVDERASLDGGGGDVRYNWSADGGTTWSAQDLQVNSWTPGSAHVADLNVALVDGTLLAAWSDDRSGAPGAFATQLQLGEGAVLPGEAE